MESGGGAPVARKKLRGLNIAAASLHGALLILLVAYAAARAPLRTRVVLSRDATRHSPGRTLEDIQEKCTFWPPQTKVALPGREVDVYAMTLAFTVITFAAHVAYALDPGGFYSRAVESGRNPYRWVEYGASASVMAMMLAVLSGVRDAYDLALVFVATAAVMFQGYSIEKFASAGAAARDPVSLGCALLVGWGLTAAAWAKIGGTWTAALEDAGDAVDSCGKRETSGPPGFLKYLIVVVALFFVSFGAVSLVHVFHALWTGAPVVGATFGRYETAYISLSFAAKATLVVWCASSVFSGELLWLQAGGAGDPDGGLNSKFTQ